jgi:hypothetical protein
MVRISIPHYGTTPQVDVPKVSRKNSVRGLQYLHFFYCSYVASRTCFVTLCISTAQLLFLVFPMMLCSRLYLNLLFIQLNFLACRALPNCLLLDWLVPCYFDCNGLLLQILLVVAALALCVALSMFVADKYLTNTGYALESNSSDEDNIECVLEQASR